MDEYIGKKWGELAHSTKTFYLVNPQILEIKPGQNLEAADEANGGIKVVVGLTAQNIAVDGLLFAKSVGPNGQRHEMSDARIKEAFATNTPLYIEIPDESLLIDGSGFDWQW